MRELIPSQPIPAAQPGPLPMSGGPLGNPSLTRVDGSTSTVQDVLAGTYTDGFIVLHDGQVVAEQYDNGHDRGHQAPDHVGVKSVLGCTAGVLADRGLLDVRAPVTAYVPEVGRSGYAGATIRDLLDMRTGWRSARPTPHWTPRSGSWNAPWAGGRAAR